jgi:bifunctional non-homologous end joining protein LigD
MKVELATLSKQAPRGPLWIHEVKYDGYRILARINAPLKGRASVKLETRNGNNWTAKFKIFSRALAKTFPRGHSALLDGELVAYDLKGRSDFSTLQNVLLDGHVDQLVYCAFDLLEFDGRDLRDRELRDRKALLARLIEKSDPSTLRYSAEFATTGLGALRKACRCGFEGIVSKRADSFYHSGRSEDWLKVKCSRRQELVIGAYTPPKGSRIEFGALLLGYYKNGNLLYAGKVGTGFNAKTLREVRRRMRPLEQKSSPFQDPNMTSREGRDATWLEPKLVAEIEFTEWTHDGHLRHPVFLGLREDKTARSVVKEEAR